VLEAYRARLLCPLLALALMATGCGDHSKVASSPPLEELLSGQAPVESEALVRLARERVALGGRWLAGAVRPEGAFFYQYHPYSDAFEEVFDSEVRQAGTTYALYQVIGIVGDPRMLEAAEGAAGWIERQSVPSHGRPGRAYVYDGSVKLGGQALALVALLERRRVTGDRAYDRLIRDLSAFLLSMQVPGRPGEYSHAYDHETGTFIPEEHVVFFPGETLLAMTRLAAQGFTDQPWLQRASELADFIIRRQDFDIPATGRIPREDHWLCIALSELYRLDPRPEYATVMDLEVSSMLGSLYQPDETPPERIGALRDDAGISYTSTATRGEALMAAWSLAAHRGDTLMIARIRAAAERLVQFQMRVQYTRANTGLFRNPDALIGAWPGSAVIQDVQIDYVQHNVSSLANYVHLASGADIPQHSGPA